MYFKATITYKIIPEDDARVTALQSGQINFNDTVPTVNFESIKNDPNFAVYSVAAWYFLRVHDQHEAAADR